MGVYIWANTKIWLPLSYRDTIPGDEKIRTRATDYELLLFLLPVENKGKPSGLFPGKFTMEEIDCSPDATLNKLMILFEKVASLKNDEYKSGKLIA